MSALDEINQRLSSDAEFRTRFEAADGYDAKAAVAAAAGLQMPSAKEIGETQLASAAGGTAFAAPEMPQGFGLQEPSEGWNETY